MCSVRDDAHDTSLLTLLLGGLGLTYSTYLLLEATFREHISRTWVCKTMNRARPFCHRTHWADYTNASFCDAPANWRNPSCRRRHRSGTTRKLDLAKIAIGVKTSAARAWRGAALFNF